MTGVLGSAAAFGIQTLAQRYISPSKTALVLILEPVFGGLFGWLAGEMIGVGGLVGGALILTGMILAEVVGASAPPEDRVELEPSLEGIPVPVAEGPPEESG